MRSPFLSENGKVGGRLVGIVTNRDVDFIAEEDNNQLVSEVKRN